MPKPVVDNHLRAIVAAFKKIGIDLVNEQHREDGTLQAALVRHQVEWLRTYAEIITCVPAGTDYASEYGEKSGDANFYCEVIFWLKSPVDTLPEPYPGWNETFEGKPPGHEGGFIEVPAEAAVQFANGVRYTLHREPPEEVYVHYFTRNPFSPPDYVPPYVERAGMGGRPAIQSRPALPARHGAKWYFSLGGDIPHDLKGSVRAYGPFDTEAEARQNCEYRLDLGFL